MTEQSTQDQDDPTKFVSSLSTEDVKALKKLIGIYRSISGWCRVNRWLAVFAIGAVIAVAQFIDAIKSILGVKH